MGYGSRRPCWVTPCQLNRNIRLKVNFCFIHVRRGSNFIWLPLNWIEPCINVSYNYVYCNTQQPFCSVHIQHVHFVYSTHENQLHVFYIYCTCSSSSLVIIYLCQTVWAVPLWSSCRMWWEKGLWVLKLYRAHLHTDYVFLAHCWDPDSLHQRCLYPDRCQTVLKDWRSPENL